MARHRNTQKVVRVVKLTLQRGAHDRLIELIEAAPPGHLARVLVSALLTGAQPAQPYASDDAAELEDLLTGLL